MSYGPRSFRISGTQFSCEAELSDEIATALYSSGRKYVAREVVISSHSRIDVTWIEETSGYPYLCAFEVKFGVCDLEKSFFQCARYRDAVDYISLFIPQALSRKDLERVYSLSDQYKVGAYQFSGSRIRVLAGPVICADSERSTPYRFRNAFYKTMSSGFPEKQEPRSESQGSLPTSTAELEDEVLKSEEGIVWLEDVSKFKYVRQSFYCGFSRRSGQPRCDAEGRIVGYSTVRCSRKAGRLFTRRVFWVKPYDHSEMPNGTYAKGYPSEAVDPRTVWPRQRGYLNTEE